MQSIQTYLNNSLFLLLSDGLVIVIDIVFISIPIIYFQDIFIIMTTVLAQTKDTENPKKCLVYSKNFTNFEDRFFNILQENVKFQDYPDIPILNYEQLMYRVSHQKERTPDKKLEEHKIRSYNELLTEVTLIRDKKSNLPKAIRDLCCEKFTDISNE